MAGQDVASLQGLTCKGSLLAARGLNAFHQHLERAFFSECGKTTTFNVGSRSIRVDVDLSFLVEWTPSSQDRSWYYGS